MNVVNKTKKKINNRPKRTINTIRAVDDVCLCKQCGEYNLLQLEPVNFSLWSTFSEMCTNNGRKYIINYVNKRGIKCVQYL